MVNRLTRTMAALVPAFASGLTGQEVPINELTSPSAVIETQFSLIRGLRELPDGGVLVTDWLERRLVEVDFTSGAVRDIGRQGRGPSEYTFPAGLFPMPGDSTLMVDAGNARFSVIGPDRRIHRTIPAQQGNAPYSISPAGLDDRGRLYFAIPRWARGPNAAPTDSAEIARFDPAAGSLEVIAKFRASTPRGPGMGVPFVMFAPQDAWTVFDDGSLAIVRSVDYHVDWIAPSGATVSGPSTAFRPLEVTLDDKRDYIRRFLSTAVRSGRGGEAQFQQISSDSDEVERLLPHARFADTKPAFPPGGAHATSGGSLWVERYTVLGAPARFDVFDKNGAHVMTVELPAGRRVVGFGRDAVYAVVTDEFDLETLEKYVM